MEYVSGVVCSRIITDRHLNTVSLIDLIEEMQTTELPIKIQNIAVSCLWTREETDQEAEFQARFELIAPDGKRLIDYESEPVQIQPWRNRINLNMAYVQFHVEGRYQVVVSSRAGSDGHWIRNATIPFMLRLSPNLREELELERRHSLAGIPAPSSEDEEE